MNVQGTILARATSDAEDRLLNAEEPLAGLQLRCGGELPGKIAIPSLLELVRRSHRTNLRLAQPISAHDGEDTVTAWIEVAPRGGVDGGCDIAVASWRLTPMLPEDLAENSARRVAIDRQLAEISARLDPQQGLLTVDGQGEDVTQTVIAMRGGLGQPWTDFVEVKGSSHEQPLHWRLLDGARVTLPGSLRNWTVSLVPLGSPEPGRAGFELYLVADEPPPPSPRRNRRKRTTPIGREIAPVLRQPIARIIANAETIRSRLAGPLAEEYSNYAADIASAGQHLLSLIEDLADLEVVEADDFITAPDSIDLADVARRAAGILGVRAQERGIALIAPQAGESLPAIGEFRRVLQVLLNLLGNAIRYTPEGSQVWLRLERLDDKARIIVADQGQGLSEADQAKVFTKFERLGRSGDGGSGLGLYISRRLARAMGGELSVESAMGQGARFILDLPVAE
jgi:hypothetical protein